MFRCLPPALTAQQARRQKQDRPQQREYTLAGDAQDTKWDRDHPDDRPQQERQQCQRPAQFLLWLLLLVMCWPLALLAVLFWPIVWGISIPFRILGIACGGGFALLRAGPFLSG